MLKWKNVAGGGLLAAGKESGVKYLIIDKDRFNSLLISFGGGVFKTMMKNQTLKALKKEAQRLEDIFDAMV